MSQSSDRPLGRRAAGWLGPATCDPGADVGTVVPAYGRNRESDDSHAPDVLAAAVVGQFGHSGERHV
jgi:hypothetical protein